MKNPLNVVAGRLELLDVDDTHGEAVQRSLGRVESLLDEVSVVADATGPADRSDAVDIAATAERIWSELDPDTATLVAEVDGTVEGDGDAVAQLLKRLLDNAVTHGGDGVTVTVGDAPGGFFVADDGPGVPADDRGRVFEQGYGTTPHGEGYGLFVASRIARANGWEITLGESDACGARFAIHDR
jgi:signal transduction histidine kinase